MAAYHKKSQEKRKALKGIELHSRRLVENLHSSILVIKLNAITKKIDFSGDHISVDLVMQDSNVVNKLKDILEHSREIGDLQYVDNDDATKKLNTSKGKDCLPRTVYKIFSEKDKLLADTGCLRKTFTGMMKCQGYGRNARCRYGEGNSPVWWDEGIVSWDTNFKGVTTPTNWKRSENGPWTFALYELIKKCYIYYMEEDEADAYTVDNSDIVIDEAVVFTHNRSNTDVITDESIQDDFENLDMSFEGILNNIENLECNDMSLSRLLGDYQDNTVTPDDASADIEQSNIIETISSRGKRKSLTQQTINKCPICGRMFITKKLLKEHMENVHNVTPNIIKASEISRKRKNSDTDNPTEFKCSACGKIYKRECWLKKHKCK